MPDEINIPCREHDLTSVQLERCLGIEEDMLRRFPGRTIWEFFSQMMTNLGRVLISKKLVTNGSCADCSRSSDIPFGGGQLDIRENNEVLFVASPNFLIIRSGVSSAMKYVVLEKPAAGQAALMEVAEGWKTRSGVGGHLSVFECENCGWVYGFAARQWSC